MAQKLVFYKGRFYKHKLSQFYPLCALRIPTEPHRESHQKEHGSYYVYYIIPFCRIQSVTWLLQPALTTADSEENRFDGRFETFSFYVKSLPQKSELLIKLQNCILDKFVYAIFFLIKNINLNQNNFSKRKNKNKNDY